MDLLLLAHLVADGNQDAKASSAPVWATWVPATIGLLGSLGVAWWSGRKIDKQMELSKQATPPELTRYKEWLEASEKYKEIMEFEKTNSVKDTEKEYQEIIKSRKDALDRAVWERKVFAACSDSQARKHILSIAPSVISEYHKNKSGEVEVYYVNPKNALSFIMMVIFFVAIWILYGFLIYSGSQNEVLATLLAFVLASLVTLLVHPLSYWFSFDLYGGSLKANYYLRKMICFSHVENDESENSGNEKIYINVDQEKIIMIENLRYAAMDSGWEALVNCPWDSDGFWRTFRKKFMCMYKPSSYVSKDIEEFRKINTGDEKGAYVLLGSYKDKILNGDLKQKIELCREDSRCQKEVALEGGAVGIGSDNKN